MAFKVTAKPKGSSNELPWANEYVESSPEGIGNIWDVVCIKLKPKGLILETDSWAGWLFKSTDEYKQLVIYLEHWYESKQSHPTMQLQLTEEQPFFYIGEDDERTTEWVLEKTTYYQVSSMLKTRQQNLPLNLTLPTNVPSSSELPTTLKDELADKRANEHRQQTGKKKPPEESLAGVIARK